MVVINIPRQRQRAEEAGVDAEVQGSGTTTTTTRSLREREWVGIREREREREKERISDGNSRNERNTRRCLLKVEPEEFSDDEFVAFRAFAVNHRALLGKCLIGRVNPSIRNSYECFAPVPLSLSLLTIGFEISSSLESLWHGASANLNGLEKIRLAWRWRKQCRGILKYSPYRKFFFFIHFQGTLYAHQSYWNLRNFPVDKWVRRTSYFEKNFQRISYDTMQ